LLYEFVHAHPLQGWRMLESASVSYGKATPYFPLIDLLRRYSGSQLDVLQIPTMGKPASGILRGNQVESLCNGLV
jgi:hypothetical protein